MFKFVIYCHSEAKKGYFIVIMSHSSRAFEKGAILLANEAVIPEKPVRQACVQSRMVVWCRKGKGVIAVNNREHALVPGDFLFLPWNRSMVYSREKGGYFVVAGIHIIPDHGRNVPLSFHIGHSREDPFHDAPYRRDAELPGLPRIFEGRFRNCPALEGLCEYIVRRFQEGEFGEWEARRLSALLLMELKRCLSSPRSVEAAPPRLEKLLEKMRVDLNCDYSLPALSAELRTSVSGVIRLFRRHLGLTPGRYLVRQRLAAAERLLITTGLPIRIVGQRAGIQDEYYFSKLFKKEKGISARAYRMRNLL